MSRQVDLDAVLREIRRHQSPITGTIGNGAGLLDVVRSIPPAEGQPWGESELAEAIRPVVASLLTTNRHVELVANECARVALSRPIKGEVDDETR